MPTNDERSTEKKVVRWRRYLYALLLMIAICALGLLWLLQRGVTINSVSVGTVRLEQIDLALDGKLVLSIDRLAIAGEATAPQPQRRQSDEPVFEPRQLKRLLSAIRYATRLFRRIEVQSIEGRRLSGAFRYRENEPGYLKLHSPGSSIELGISGNEERLRIDLFSLDLLDGGIQAVGQATLDVAERRLQAELRGELAGVLPVELAIDVDRRELRFKGLGLEPLATIAPIVDLFPLPESVTPWISDYLVGSAYHLDDISGTLPFADPAAILQTLRVAAHVDDAAYTFAQGLEPVLAPRAEVVFERGVLTILPKEGTFYGLDGGDSYLDIDFNVRPFLLAAYIRAQAPASGGILTLLEHYSIAFPFEQVAGLTDVDLTLGIGLATPVGIDAKANFSTRDAAILYRGQRYQVPVLDMALHNSLLTFNRLDLTVAEGIAVSLSGQVDTRSKEGELAIAVQELQGAQKQSQLSLETSPEKPTTAVLQLSPSGHQLIIPATNWRYGARHIAIESFSTPLEIGSLAGLIPPTMVSVDHVLRARVKGPFNATRRAVDLQVDLQHLAGDNLRLAQKQATLALQLGEGLHLATQRPVKLTSKGVGLVLAPSRVHYTEGRLRIERSGLEIDGGLSATLSGAIDNRSRSGTLTLGDVAMRDADGRASFAADVVTLELARDDQALAVRSPELGLNMALAADGGWSLDCPDLGTLQPYSSLLQRQGIERGAFHIDAPAAAEHFTFQGWVAYPYALLVQEGEPTGEFHFTGWRDGATTHLSINDALEVELGYGIRASSTGVGYNLAELLRLARANAAQRPASEKPGDDRDAAGASRRINFRARDTHLRLSDDRRILADNLLLHGTGSSVKINLRHGAGMAVLELEDGQLQLAGKNFDHRFINGLMANLADFDQGSLEIHATGSLQQFDAAVAARDFVVKDFKALNNTLTFINRLPGALNFNPPAHHDEGLLVREAAVAFGLSDRVMNVQSLLIDSDELTVQGKGVLDLNDETIDMIFRLASAARKSRSGVPVVGFVLEGKYDKNAVTVKLEGDMFDPEVSNTLVKELVTYPFKVLARTILLPVHLIQSVQPDDQDATAGDAPPP
jgi:hypothetical protein